MNYLNIFIEVLKNFGDFKTRTNKTNFWVFIFISILINIVIGMLNSHLLSSLYSLLILVPSLAVGARRLHDIGKSGWTQLWILTIVGIVYLIYLWIQDSELSENQWGKVSAKSEEP